jgi:Ca-activated chloride channel family protein
MVKHYSERTTEFRDYIAQGPDYVDFVALQEDALLSINLGQAQFTPPEKLVALYPKEGTFWFDHPFAIPNTAWVSPEQRAAAGLFTDYVLSAEVQKLVLTLGLMRPVNPAVQLGYPYVAELGVEPARQRNTALTPPPADVIAAAQASWQYVKKQADILLLFDTSGSMQGDKLDKAKAAALQFVRQLAPQNRVAVATFNDTAQLVLPFAKLENAPDALNNAIGNLSTNGGTALYDGLLQAAATLQQEGDGRIRAIVLLSDGQDTASNHTLQEVLTLDRGANNPLLIFPVAYGSDADIGILNNIARMSATKVLSGAPEDIDQLFELLSSFF